MYYLHILFNHLLWSLFVIIILDYTYSKGIQCPKSPKKEKLNTQFIQKSYIQTSKEIQTSMSRNNIFIDETMNVWG